MSDEICETVDGSIPIVKVIRKQIWDPAPLEANSVGIYNIKRKGCFEFTCRCIDKKGVTLKNEGWTINKYIDKKNHCIHLLSLLTVYEMQRLKLLNQEPKDNLSVLLHKSAEENMSYEDAEECFNYYKITDDIQAIFLTDPSMRKHYTVKCSKKKWSCSCKGYKNHLHCKHIDKVKLDEERKQNRRELGISLAILSQQNPKSIN